MGCLAVPGAFLPFAAASLKAKEAERLRKVAERRAEQAGAAKRAAPEAKRSFGFALEGAPASDGRGQQGQGQSQGAAAGGGQKGSVLRLLRERDTHQ